MQDVDKVHVSWSLPSFLQHYRTQPLGLLGFLVGHEGPGSMVDLLRRRYGNEQ